jgi:hypothetical protein
MNQAHEKLIISTIKARAIAERELGFPSAIANAVELEDALESFLRLVDRSRKLEDR